MHEHEQTERSVAQSHGSSGVLTFVACILLLLGGFLLMGYSFAVDSGLLFGVGLALSGGAFMIPLSART